MKEFIERYKDSIICEPSGLTYTNLKYQMTKKFIIINEEGV